MPLKPDMLYTAVRITSVGDLCASGFILGVPSESDPRRIWRYIVTADHVVRNEIELAVEVPDPLSEHGELYPPVPIQDWRQPLPGVDLAIAPYLSHPSDKPVAELNLDEHMMPEGSVPYLGGTIFYVGIFAIPEVPMVRSATLGALAMPVEYERTGHSYSYTGHLVDCRSYGGFSGSVCLAELTYARADLHAEPPLGPQTREMIRRPDGEMPTFWEPFHMASICGLFAAHFSDDPAAGGPISHYGVGVMVPHRYIREALMTDEAKQERRTWDEHHGRMQAARQPNLRPASASEPPQGSEFENFEELTTKLVQTPKPKPD
jgi:hypothetical protein